jgi:ferredoxin
MGFRVVVDRDLCQGHGVCESEAEEVFAVSRSGDLTVLDDTPADELLAKVQLAVKYCPTHALSIIAETNPGGSE